VANGTYNLNAPVAWASSDQGSDAEGHVYLVGEVVPTAASGAWFSPGASFSGASALSISASYVTVKNVGFRSFSTANSAGVEVLPSSDHTRLISNRFERCAVGIRLGQQSGSGHSGPVLVQNNLITNTSPMVVPGAIGVHCPKKPALQPGGFGGFYSILNNTLVLEQGTGLRFDFQPFECSGCTSVFDAVGGHTVEVYNNIMKCDSSAGACVQVGGSGILASNHNNFLGPVKGRIGVPPT
jgi:hypothetical protein